MKVCIKWFKRIWNNTYPPRHLMNRYPKWRHIWSQRYIKKIHHFLVSIPKFGTEVLASRAWNELNHALFQVDGISLPFTCCFPAIFSWEEVLLHPQVVEGRSPMGVVQYPPHYADIMRRKCVCPEGRTWGRSSRMLQSFHFIVPPPDSPSNHDGTFVTSSQTFKAIWNFQGSQLLLTNPKRCATFFAV